MCEVFPECISNELNKKTKIKRLNSKDDILNFFYTLKKQPEKCPKWIKEMTGNKDISLFLVFIYKALKQESVCVQYEINYLNIDEESLINEIKRIFEEKKL